VIIKEELPDQQNPDHRPFRSLKSGLASQLSPTIWPFSRPERNQDHKKKSKKP
jgi:hypothetical protein